MAEDRDHGRTDLVAPPDCGPISIEVARSLYTRSGGGHDFDHVLRVWALAERIARLEGADLGVVCTAALLHDVGEADGRADHHVRGAALARELLVGESAGFVDSVAHAIEAHRFRADPPPCTLEAKIVSDADKLDAIGAIGVARVFAHAGSRGTALWRLPWRNIVSALGGQDSDGGEGQDRVTRANLGPSGFGADYTPGHEFVYKLDRIPLRLYTETARAIAVDRHRVMREFFDRLDDEMRGTV